MVAICENVEMGCRKMHTPIRGGHSKMTVIIKHQFIDSCIRTSVTLLIN